MPSVLFVCTANQCRSPMAEAIFRELLREKGRLPGWSIGSAGVRASPGEPATLFTQSTLRERGIETGAHRSRPVTEEVLRSYNLVLTMERAQQDELRAAYPDMADKIGLLATTAGGQYDIDDPIGLPLERYRALANELSDILGRGLSQIEWLAADPGHA